MFAGIARRVAGPFVLARLMSALQTRGAMPIPSDDPRVDVEGPETQRVLLLGGIVAGSHGVTSHQLGMAGHLARMVHSVTRRGVQMEVESVLPGSARQFTRELERIRVTGFDAIVTFVGGVETRSLWPDRRWRRDMGELLTTLRERAPGTPILVVGVTHLPETLDVPRRLLQLVDASTDRLNRVTLALVDDLPDAHFLTLRVPLPAAGDQLMPSYADGANAIAPVLARVLLDRPRSGALDPEHEQRRQDALDLLGVVDSGFDHRYDRIADNARELLAASGAAITFLDRDRQYIKAAVGLPTADTSRWFAFCDSTIRGSGGFVVSDIDDDSAFAAHPWVLTRNVRSYAGFPLRAPSGEAVGALCVVDSVARSYSELDLSLLRQLAARLQLLLWSDGDPARRQDLAG